MELAMGIDEYRALDGTALAELIRKKEILPEEAYLLSCEVDALFDPYLNYISQSMSRLALSQLERLGETPGEAPLRGVPMTVKDLVAEVAGYPTLSGTSFLSSTPARRDSEIIAQYKAAGLILTNKTAVPQFGASPMCESKTGGTTRNPWDLSRNSGGSSGGAAVSVAVGATPIAHGNDGGGSLRIPGSHCGVFALKPTRGRTSLGPWLDCWQGMTVQHCLTRSVRDSAQMLAIEAASSSKGLYACPPAEDYVGDLERDPGRLRIGFTRAPFFGGELDKSVCVAFDEAVKKVASLGHDMEPDWPTFPPVERMGEALGALIGGEMAATRRLIKWRFGHEILQSEVEPGVWALIQYGEQITAGEYVDFYRELTHECAKAMRLFHARRDILMTPVYPEEPPKNGKMTANAFMEAFASWALGPMRMGWALRNNPLVNYNSAVATKLVGFTQPFNITGQPAMSVPLARTPSGLPIGVQFVAPYGEEGLLLRLARQLEKAFPWAQIMPPLPPPLRAPNR